jgi:hypothetical protein
MRTLLYVPIIHMTADLGSLAPDVAQRGIRGVGEEGWRKHLETVEGFWNSLATYFDAMEAAGVRLYQDGLVANGDMGRRIVEEGAKSGSKNYEIIAGLIGKGALLVRTEDLELAKKERDHLVEMTRATTRAKKMIAYLGYMRIKNHLLEKRDRFIAGRINETLGPDETGVLFIGAYHKIIPFLEKDIRVREIKEIEKIREYQRTFLHMRKNKERFEALSMYLISPVCIERSEGR